MSDHASVPLFVYGPLAAREVQQATFGRLLDGAEDAIVGFELRWLTITDPDVIATSGTDRHPVLHTSVDPAATVNGTVFLITPRELSQADRYEVDDYERVLAPLRSGGQAWAYLAAVLPDHGELDALYPLDERGEPITEEHEPKPTSEELIEQVREERLNLGGLPVDDASLRWAAGALPGLGLTHAEWHDEVPQHRTDEADAYLEARPGLSGGTWLGYRDGRKTYFVSVVEDLQAHRAALDGDRVTVVLALHSEAELDAVCERLGGDLETLCADGVDICSVGFAPQEGVVEVEIVGSELEHAERVVLERYGPAVRITHRHPSWTRVRPYPFGSWTLEADTLTVYYAVSPNGEAHECCVAVEEADAVRITVTISEPAIAATLIGGHRVMSANIALKQPLGDRAVIDTTDGRRRPSLGEVRARPPSQRRRRRREHPGVLIEELQLTPVAIAALKRGGIHTVESLIKHSAEDIEAMTTARADEILHALRQRGVTLP